MVNEHVLALRRALEGIIANDATPFYEHHQKRRSDGKTPQEATAEGTCWLTPREIARSVQPDLDALEREMEEQSHA